MTLFKVGKFCINYNYAIKLSRTLYQKNAEWFSVQDGAIHARGMLLDFQKAQKNAQAV